MGEEVSNFVAEYFASVDPIGLPTSRHKGRLEGNGTIMLYRSYILWLAFGEVVRSYEGYDIQYASSKDKSLVLANINYYGSIEEIWELDYYTFHICLLCCKWVDNDRHCVKKKKDDPCGITLVDLGRLRETQEPFVLASQVKQVFYVTDPPDNKWSIVVPGKRSIIGIGDVDDEEGYDVFEDILSFTYLKNRVEDDVNMSQTIILLLKILRNGNLSINHETYTKICIICPLRN